MRFLKAMQTSDRGNLQVQITSSIDSFPVPDASIRISYTGIPENTLEELTTDSSGQSETIELDAPPVEYSLDATNEEQPYAEYTIQVEAEGFENTEIAGTQVLPGSKRSGIRAGQRRRNGNTGRCDGNSEDSSASTCHGRPDPGNLCDSCTYSVRCVSAENPGKRDQAGKRNR